MERKAVLKERGFKPILLVKLVELNTNGDRVLSKIHPVNHPLIFDKPGYAYLTLIHRQVFKWFFSRVNL